MILRKFLSMQSSGTTSDWNNIGVSEAPSLDQRGSSEHLGTDTPQNLE
jgi:hypothetical protein